MCFISFGNTCVELLHFRDARLDATAPNIFPKLPSGVGYGNAGHISFHVKDDVDLNVFARELKEECQRREINNVVCNRVVSVRSHKERLSLPLKYAANKFWNEPEYFIEGTRSRTSATSMAGRCLRQGPERRTAGVQPGHPPDQDQLRPGARQGQRGQRHGLRSRRGHARQQPRSRRSRMGAASPEGANTRSYARCFRWRIHERQQFCGVLRRRRALSVRQFPRGARPARHRQQLAGLSGEGQEGRPPHREHLGGRRRERSSSR